MELTTKINYFLEVSVNSGSTQIKEDVGANGKIQDRSFVNSIHEVARDCYHFENKGSGDTDFIEHLIEHYQLTEREIDNLVERLRNR